MKAIDYKEALDRFCYVAEKKAFYNKHSKKAISEKGMRARIEELYPTLATDGAKLDLVVSEIKSWAYTPAELKAEKPSKKQLRNAVYDEVSGSLPVMWRVEVDGESKLYYVNEIKEVTFCGQVSYDNFSNVIKGGHKCLETLQTTFDTSKACKQLQKNGGMSQFDDYLRVIFQQFQYDPTKKITEEPPIITHDPEKLAYKRFDASLLKEGDTPAWDEFLTRMDYPEIFMAWVWSIFEPENQGRQIMWMQGSGNDGKSTAISAITEFLGPKHCMPIQENVNSQFYYSSVYGKRLATFGDCKSPRYISGSKVHSLVGGDYVSIERKGEQPFSAFVRIKMLIASNLFPQIDFSMPNEYTRLILVKVSPPETLDGDKGYKERMISEKWQFLARCKKMYEKHCPKHTQISISEEHFESMQIDAGSEESGYVEEFVHKYLEFEDKAKIRVGDLHRTFDEHARMQGFTESKLARMKRDLALQMAKKGVEKKKARFKSGSESKVERAYLNVKLKEGVL